MITTSLTTPSPSSAWHYWQLMKPRVMGLVIFTACSGLYLAPGTLHPILTAAAILFTAVGSGSAAAINMWYDRDIDSIMQRTSKRPTVTGYVPPEEALAFGVITGILSVLLMALCINILSGILLAITILYYVFIYTMWLKRSSVQNVVIGGVAGAIPPLIGWASVTNDISLQGISLFLIIFLWTPPHSWALTLFRQQDYQACNIPMMPVIKGQTYTKRQIIIYSILMLLASSMPYYLHMANFIYLLSALIMGSYFMWLTIKLYKATTNITTNLYAKKLFWFSIFYLFIIFWALIIFKI